MGIRISYTPMDAVMHLADQSGAGQFQQKQAEFALREQALAQQQFNQDADRQARLYGQQQQLAAQQQSRADQIAMNQQYRGEQNYQREFATRYGNYTQQMQHITDLEKQGFQYSPDQQRQIDLLKADYDRVLADDHYGPEQERDAEMQYYAQRAKIRPTAPPPKSPDEVLKSSVGHYTFPDGSTVPGIVGVRNGAPTFDPIENPGVKQAQDEQEATFEREKFKQQMELGQAKLDQQVTNLELQRYKNIEAQEDRAETRLQTRKDNLAKAYDRMRDAQLREATKKPVRDPETDEEIGPSLEERQRRIEEAFKLTHGADVKQFLPEVADALGLNDDPTGQDTPGNRQAAINALHAQFGPNGPPPNHPYRPEWDFLMSGSPRRQPQGGDETSMPQIPAGGQPGGIATPPAAPPAAGQADPRIATAKAAAEAALHSNASPAEKADAQALLDELARRGL